MGCNQNCGLLTGAILGALVAILGGILIPVGNYFIEKTVKKETVIENGTIAYENWIVPGSPVYRQFWIFDVQNPEAVTVNGSRPVLKQKGPYTYRMRYLPKENITQNNDSTVSFFQPNIIRFEPDMSIGPENDTYNVANLAVIAVPALYPSGFVQSIVDIWIKSSKSQLVQRRTVKELLWGYEDPFLKKIPFPGIEKVIGVFLPYNNTLDGLYTVYTGNDDTSKTAIIQSYKNKSTLGFWPGSCDMVNGTDGASFPPFLNKHQTLHFFSSDVCRSFYGNFDSEQLVKEIPLYRFIVPPSAFASPEVNPDNICFCLNKEVSLNCTYFRLSHPGTSQEPYQVKTATMEFGMKIVFSTTKALSLTNLETLYKVYNYTTQYRDLGPNPIQLSRADAAAMQPLGKPVVITLPHFLYASKEVSDGVEGMYPNLKEHMTYLDVEPTTGFTLQFAKRLQINLLVMPSEKITPLKVVDMPFVFPILWLNETAIIGDDKAEFFRKNVTNKIKMLHLLQAVLIIVGSVVFLGCMVSYVVCRAQKKKV